MIVYIAGPMTGYPEYNYPAFHAAEAALTAAGHEVKNPAHSSPTDPTYQNYLRAALRLLLDCDAIAVLPGWEFSTGANLEVAVAEVLKIPIHTVTYMTVGGLT